MSPGTTLTILITLCVLTTSYTWAFGATSLGIPTSPQHPGRNSHVLYSQNPASKSCSSPTSGLPNGIALPKSALVSLSSQTQQRWVERPVQITPFPPINARLLTPAIILPIIPSPRSAHRNWVWNPSAFADSFLSPCFSFVQLEAMELIKGPVQAKSVESTRFEVLNSPNRYCRVQGQKQDLPPRPSRGFSSGQTSCFGRPRGWGVRNTVKTAEHEKLHISGPPLGVVPSITYTQAETPWRHVSTLPWTSTGGRRAPNDNPPSVSLARSSFSKGVMKLRIFGSQSSYGVPTTQLLLFLCGGAQQVEALADFSSFQTAIPFSPECDAILCDGSFFLFLNSHIGAEERGTVRQDARCRGIHAVLYSGSQSTFEFSDESDNPASAKPATTEEICAALMSISRPVTARGYGKPALMTEN